MRFKLQKLGILVFVIALATIANPQAQAQESAFQACLDIKNSQERLRCFDHAAAETKKPIPNINLRRTNNPDANADVRSIASSRDDFGRSSMKRPETPEKDSLTVTLVSWKKTLHGKLIFTTSDGQVWRQTDTARLLLRGSNLPATITRTAMGGYRLSIDGIKRGAQVKREK